MHMMQRRALHNHRSASAILGDTATAIDDGVSAINVENAVEAGVGVQLGQLEEDSFYDGSGVDVNFNVVDDANDIYECLINRVQTL